MGTHDVFMADIVSVSCDEKLMDGKGKIRFDKADLLAYVHGEYFRIGERLGAFGFSTEKGRRPSDRIERKQPSKAKKPQKNTSKELRKK